MWEHVQELSFNTVLDIFGGTGVVGYWLKQKGKQVTYNDISHIVLMAFPLSPTWRVWCGR
ncbi:MAG: DNA adenine methylase [Chloroflexota bacterium]|nr:DNA adenine methylase [Chloroflexota bacterium]